MADINFEVSGFKTFRQELKDAQIEMQKVIAQFGETSVQAQNAAKNVAEIKDKIDDANDAVSSFTGAGQFQAIGKAVQATAGAFAAAQGAAALFGSESEDLQKTMAKLQGAMALTQGLAALEDAGRSFKQLGTVAVQAFTKIEAAIGSTGVGLLIIGIGIAVQQLISYMSELSDEEARNKKEAEGLARANDVLQRTYDVLNQSIRDQMDLDVARAELAGKTEEDLTAIRKKAINDQLAAIDKQVNDEIQLYKERQDSIRKNFEDEKERKIELDKLSAEFAKKGEQLGDRKAQLEKQLEMEDIQLQLKQKERNEKAAKENEKRIEDENKNEVESLYALNEARRNLLLSRETTERGIINRTFENSIERLKEQQAKELEQENLTEEAKKNINDKYALLRRTAKINQNKDLAELDKKEAAEAEERVKEAEAKRQATLEKSYQRSIGIVDDYYKYKQIELDNAILSEEDYAKKSSDLELKRLEDQLKAAEKAGQDTVDLEAQIAAKKREIRNKDEDDQKKRIEIIREFEFQQAQELLNNLKSFSDERTLRETENAQIAANQRLALAKGNAEQEKIIQGELAVELETIKKDAFERDKAFQYANAVVTGIRTVMEAYSSGVQAGGPIGVTVTGPLFAGIAGAQVALQLLAIANTKYHSSGSMAGSTSGGSDSKGKGSQYAEGGLLYGPSHDMGGIRTALGELEGGEFVINRQSTAAFLPLLQQINAMGNQGNPQMAGVGQGPSNIRAYVLAGDITSAQEANARLNSLAKL